MKPRTVLFVMGSLGAGGAERQLLTLIRGFDEQRWKPVVCSVRGGLLTDEFRATTETIVLEKKRKVDIPLLHDLVQVIGRVRPDVVNTYLFTGNTWGRLAVALRPIDRPIVVVSEGNIDEWKTPLHVNIDRVLLGVTDAVIGNSNSVVRYLVEHDRLSPRLVWPIHNGIDFRRAQRYLHCDPDRRNELRTALGIAKDDFVIGHLGRPDPVKRLDLLLDVLHRLNSRVRGIRCLRVGPPPLPREESNAAEFERRVAEEGLGSVVVTHPFTTDISAALAVMDAVVQTSSHEGLPNVVMEAMAMELPVVATMAGGTDEIVRDGDTGWLVPVGDVDGLVAGLDAILMNPVEAGRRAYAGRRLIETEYSQDHLAARTVALYEHLLERRAR